MSNVLFLFGDNQIIAMNGSTRFGGCVNCTSGPAMAILVTEARVQTAFPAAGTLSQLWQAIQSNARTTTTVFTVRNNSSSTAITVSVGAGVTGNINDTTHTASVLQDDLVAYQIVMGASAENLFVSNGALQFAPSSGNATALIAGGTNNGGIVVNQTTAQTLYVQEISAMATTAVSSTQSDSQVSIPSAGTSKYLQVFVSGNSRLSTSTFTQQINGTAGNQTVSFAASATGLVKDTTHTDSVSAGDLLGMAIAILASATGQMNVTTLGCWIDVTTAGNGFTGFGRISGNSNAAGTTGWYGVGTRLGTAPNTTSESQVSSQIGQATVFSKLWTNVLTNLSTSASTLQFRNNTANGNQSVSITALTGGVYQDSTHSDSVLSTDNIDMQFSGAATGAVSLAAISMLMAAPPPANTNKPSTLLMMGVG